MSFKGGFYFLPKLPKQLEKWHPQNIHISATSLIFPSKDKTLHTEMNGSISRNRVKLLPELTSVPPLAFYFGWTELKNAKISPDWCGWALSCKVKGNQLIPGQGTCLDCRFSPWRGAYNRQPIDVSLSCGCFSPSLSLSLSLSLKINKSVLAGVAQWIE